MKSTVIIFRKLSEQTAAPLIFLSVFTVLLSLTSRSESLGVLTSVLLVFYIVYLNTKNAQKGIIAAFCTSAGSVVYHSFSAQYYSLLFSVLLGVLSVLITKKSKKTFSFVILLCTNILLSFSFGMLYPYLMNFLRGFSMLIGSKGYIFGVVKNIYDMAVSDKFTDLFYYSSFSQTEIINNKAVSGAVNIFLQNHDSSVVSRYLTGEYFVCIFLSIGMLFALYNKVHLDIRIALILTVFTSVLTGDIRLFSLFLFLLSPVLYSGFLLCVLFSYVAASLLKLSIGFEAMPSVIQLFKYINSPAYFFITGFVLGLLSYFTARLIILRFNISWGNYYPENVRSIITALGGEANIVKINFDTLTVKNVNLVNILLLDCNISGNNVLLNERDFGLIKEYL